MNEIGFVLPLFVYRISVVDKFIVGREQGEWLNQQSYTGGSRGCRPFCGRIVRSREQTPENKNFM